MGFDTKLSAALQQVKTSDFIPQVDDTPSHPATIKIPAIQQVTSIFHDIDKAISILDPFYRGGSGGTIDFISPEQARGIGRFDSDNITDLYHTLLKTDPPIAIHVRPLAVRFQAMMKAYDTLIIAVHSLQSGHGVKTTEQSQSKHNSEMTYVGGKPPHNDAVSFEARNELAKRLDRRSFKRIASAVAALKKSTSRLSIMRNDKLIGKQVDQFITLCRDFLVHFTRLAPLLSRLLK